MSGLRRVRLWPDALAPNVDVDLFSLVGGQLVGMRRHLSLVRHGLSHTVDRTDVPLAPLLHDLPNEHLQRVPTRRLMVQHHGPLRLYHPPDIHGLEHKKGDAYLHLHTLRHGKQQSAS